MPDIVDIPDSTDWIGTPVASLGPVEASLRCQICKDFYQAPVITACSHTFCSACVRRSLSAVNASRKCPLCRAPFDEHQLRKNVIIEDLVRLFRVARPEILQLGKEITALKLTEPRAARKRKLDTTEERSGDPSPRKTRSQSKRSTIVQSSVSPEREGSLDSHHEPEHILQTDDGLVPCPICQRRMPEAQVFTHLDAHSEENRSSLTASRGSNLGLGQPSPHPQASTPSTKPLPTLSYSLLSEQQLRKKMRELGIPPEGSKQAMIRRHTEWRNLVNANADSSSPKSKIELLRELSQWEKVQNLGSSNLVTAKNTSVMEKNFDRDTWSKDHASDFRDLIALAHTKNKARSANEAKPLEEANGPGLEDMEEKTTRSKSISHSLVGDAKSGRPETTDVEDKANDESIPVPNKMEETIIIE